MLGVAASAPRTNVQGTARQGLELCPASWTNAINEGATDGMKKIKKFQLTGG
jgi:hypothetical protein